MEGLTISAVWRDEESGKEAEFIIRFAGGNEFDTLVRQPAITGKVYNSKTKSYEDKIDSTKFIKGSLSYIVQDWKGLTGEILLGIIAPDSFNPDRFKELGIEINDAEIPFSQDYLSYIAENCTFVFFDFICRCAINVKAFNKQKYIKTKN